MGTKSLRIEIPSIGTALEVSIFSILSIREANNLQEPWRYSAAM
jgi:hypothetical protein